MGDLTLQHVVLRIGALLLIAAVNGVAVAGAACALGDAGPRYDGRLTANPVRHLDVIGGVVAVLFTFGWIRPVAVDPVRLLGGRAGLALVVAAGTAAVLALAVGLRLVRPWVMFRLGDTAAATFFVFVETVGQMAAAFAVFNSLPLPVVTGQHWLVALWPAGRERLRRIQPYAAVGLAVVVVSGAVGWVLGPVVAAVARVLLGTN